MVAADLAALAGVLDQQGKLSEARRLYLRAIRIYERATVTITSRLRELEQSCGS